jgi:hypothetical protein
MAGCSSQCMKNLQRSDYNSSATLTGHSPTYQTQISYLCQLFRTERKKGCHRTDCLGSTLSVAHRCSIFFLSVKGGRREGGECFTQNVNYFPSDLIQYCTRKLCSTWKTFKDLCHKQGRRNPRYQVSVGAKFCPVVPNCCSFFLHFQI